MRLIACSNSLQPRQITGCSVPVFTMYVICESLCMNKFFLSSSDRPQRSVSKYAMSIGGAEFFDAWMCLFLLAKNRCSQVSKNLALFTSWIYVLKFAFQKMKEKSTYLPVRARVSRARMGVLITFTDC